MNKIKKSIIFFSIVFLFVFIFNDVSAYSFTSESGLNNTAIETGITHVDTMGNYNNNLNGLIGRIINIALSVMGVIFLGLTIYGGFIWMMARGDQSEVEKSLAIIKNSFIGMVVVLAAYALTKFIYLAFFTST